MFKTLALVLLLSSTAYAGPLTKCSGSWDGAGKTTCELLGQPGEVGTASVDFSQYSSYTLLYEITALDANNSLEFDGSRMRYFSGEQTYNTQQHPMQFALWRINGRIILGVEDLVSGDFDYNDYVVELHKSPVPEVGTLWMTLIGIASVFAPARYRVRK